MYILKVFLIVFFLVALGIYLGILTRWILLWKKAKMNLRNGINGKGETLSLVIPFRNESFRLLRLLNQLIEESKNFPDLKIILVNDHSTDSTLEEINEVVKNHANIVLIPTEGPGKKMTVWSGMKLVSSPFVITLDADVILPQHWLESVISISENTNMDLVILPVFAKSDDSFFGNLQETEFSSLTAVTGASAMSGNALMCNGANLFFKRDFYFAHIDKLRLDISSGDDMFLLQAVKEKGQLKYAFSRSLIIEIETEKRWNNFFRQRVRWAGKTVFLRDSYILFFGALLLILQCGWFFFLLFDPAQFLLFFLLKTLWDAALIWNMNLRFSRSTSVNRVVLLALLYPFYVFIITLASVFYKPSWKNRIIKY